MDSNLFNPGLLKLLDGTINPLTDTIGVVLLSPAYAFNKAHEFLSEVTANELTNSVGAGYERKVLDGKSYALVAGDIVSFDATNPEYIKINTNEDISTAIIYKVEATDGASPLIAHIGMADLVTNGSDVELKINDGGVFRVNNDLTV